MSACSAWTAIPWTNRPSQLSAGPVDATLTHDDSPARPFVKGRLSIERQRREMARGQGKYPNTSQRRHLGSSGFGERRHRPSHPPTPPFDEKSRQRRRRPQDEPDPEAMKNRPVQAAGIVDAHVSGPENIPADSRGGVQMSQSVLIEAIENPAAPPPTGSTVRLRSPKIGSPGTAARRRAMEATVRVEVLPRSARKQRPHKRLFLLGGIVTILGGLAVAALGYHTLVTRRADGATGRKSSSGHDPVRLVFPPGKCPKEMVWISWKMQGFCIDRYEYPNKIGHRPRMVGDVRRAQTLCAEAGKRLCSASEWRRACGGPMLLTYPYGEHFNPSKCPARAQGGPPVPVQRSGSWSECKSPENVHDMSGNMAEWVSEGLLVGGSGMLTGRQVTCTAQGGAGQPAYYGTRCCLSPALPARR